MKNWLTSIQIAATYIGTIVGAGFASGQEIIAFFTRYGAWGAVGIAVATFFFIYLGYKMMMISHHLGSPSYESFNRALFGPFIGSAINLFIFITLLGVTTVMLAGSGSILEEQFGLSYLLGVGCTVVLSFAVLQKGLTSLLAVNSIVVPMMILFSCLVLFGTENITAIPAKEPANYFFLWKAILYVSFNLAMAQSVLIPIGSYIKDPSILKRGAMIGGIVLGFMLISSHVAMLSQWDEVRMMDIPMVVLINEWNDWLQLFFVFVLFCEIFTTLISNVYGITQQLRELFPVSENTLYVLLFTAGFGLCTFGYSQLLLFLYPLFGYLGLATVFRIMIERTYGRRL